MITCFDIGGSFIRFGQAAEHSASGYEIVSEIGRFETPLHDFDDFVVAMRSALSGADTKAVSIAMAGVFDKQTGIAKVANVPCLDGIQVVKDLTDALGLPVLISNDADCFALAEAHHGLGRDVDVVFGIILGSGVGGGVVVRGHLLSGHGGIAGEWGHGPIVDPNAGIFISGQSVFDCGCGHKGCIDTVGGARGLERLHAALHGEQLSSADITARADANEAKACATIDLFVEHVSRALSVMVNTLGPGIIPVGGGLASDMALLSRIDQRVRDLVLATYDKVLVRQGERAQDGGLVGAGIVAQQAFASGELAA